MNGSIIKKKVLIHAFVHTIYYLKNRKYKMDRMNDKSIKGRKEGVHMAVLAKPCNSVIIIKPEKTKDFDEESNKNTVSKDFLKDCKKLSKIIKHEDD